MIEQSETPACLCCARKDNKVAFNTDCSACARYDWIMYKCKWLTFGSHSEASSRSRFADTSVTLARHRWRNLRIADTAQTGSPRIRDAASRTARPRAQRRRAGSRDGASRWAPLALDWPTSRYGSPIRRHPNKETRLPRPRSRALPLESRRQSMNAGAPRELDGESEREREIKRAGPSVRTRREKVYWPVCWVSIRKDGEWKVRDDNLPDRL